MTTSLSTIPGLLEVVVCAFDTERTFGIDGDAITYKGERLQMGRNLRGIEIRRDGHELVATNVPDASYVLGKALRHGTPYAYAAL